MGEKRAVELDYAHSVNVVSRPRFRGGPISLSLAVFAAIAIIGVFLATNRIGIRPYQILYCLNYAQYLSWIALSFGVVGLVQRAGRVLAATGIALSLVNLTLLIPMANIA